MRYKGLEFQDYRRNLPWEEARELYPFSGIGSGSFQFGYESEFAAAELVPLFSHYAPAAQFGVGHWKSLRVAEKVSWVREAISNMQHGNKSTVLERISTEERLPFSLFRDDTGNLEMTTAPVNTLAEFESQTKFIESIAVGSVQAMVSMPKDKFFAMLPDPSAAGLAHLGWLNFFNELDIIERLVKGAVRFKQKPQIDPVRSFLHPYLGPMIGLRHQLLKKFLRENALGNMLTEEDLVRPARRDQSFKFVGSTAYRPDIAAPDRICFEVRDAHKDTDLLRNRVARILFYWQRDLNVFLQFSSLPAFDSAAVYDSMPAETKAWLEKITPFRAPPEVMEFEKPRFTYEVFRNFSYPMRDWNSWLLSLGAEDQRRKIQEAQQNYLKKLEVISRRPSAGTREAQGALAEFALESGLFEIFRRAEDSFVRKLHG